LILLSKNFGGLFNLGNVFSYSLLVEVQL